MLCISLLHNKFAAIHTESIRAVTRSLRAARNVWCFQSVCLCVCVCVLAEQTVVPTNAFQYSSLKLAVPRNASDTPTTHRVHCVFCGLYILSWEGGEERKSGRPFERKNYCSHWVVISGHWVPLTDWLPPLHPRTKRDRISGTCVPLRIQDYRLSPETNKA